MTAMPVRRCAEPACPHPYRARGWCDTHYKREIRLGRMTTRAAELIVDRFWSAIAVGADDACWPWMIDLNSQGYGRFTLYDGKHGRVRVLAHRFAYELHTHESAAGQEVLHRCDNPPCCNPRHLWPGTQRDNIRDAIQKGRLNLTGLVIGQKMSKRRRPVAS